MKKLVLLILLTYTFVLGQSQFHKKHENNKLKFYGALDFRTSHDDYNLFTMYGLKLGVGNKSIRFGGSYHIYHKNLLSMFYGEDFFGPLTLDHFQTNHHVGSIFTEIIAHQTPRWELIVPIHLGIGKLKLDADKAKLTHLHAIGHDFDFRQKEEWVESAVISLKANYRVMKWVGVTAGFGYNRSFSNENTIRTNFSFLFYSAGVKLFFDEFGSMFKSKEYRKKYLWEPNFVKKYE